MEQEAFAADFAARRSKRLRKAWGSYAPRQPIASDLHDCSRYQVMRVVAWPVRAMPDDEGLEVIEEGNVTEAAVLRQLADEGWEVVEQQAPFEVRQPLEPGGAKKRILTGKIDGKLRIDGGKLVPFDVKGTSEWVFEALETEEDVRNHSVWTRKWFRQMQAYMLGHGIDESLLIVSHRGHRRVIVLHLDYEVGEEILALATWAAGLIERAEADGIDEKTVDAWLTEQGGERAAYHRSMVDCRRCPFFQRACHPPDRADVTAKVRPELEALVARMLDAKPHASDYDKARKLLKAEIEGTPTVVAGRFVIEGQWKSKNMKAKPAVPAGPSAPYWSFEVEVGKA